MSRALVVIRTQADRNLAAKWAQGVPYGSRIEFKKPRRSIPANDLMWARLSEISQQVEWHGQQLEPGEWKDVFTAALKRQKVVPGLEGGFVVLGTSTSRMSKAEFSELMELIFSFGAERGVTFKEQ